MSRPRVLQSQSPQRNGCGCCGCFGCLGVILALVALALAGVIFMLYVNLGVDRPSKSAVAAADPRTYQEARRKWDDFVKDGTIRGVSLTDREINAMLANAPELGFLGRGVSMISRDNGLEFQLSVPLRLVPFYTKYINGNIFLRPIVTGENIDLNVYSLNADGRPLDTASTQRFKSQVEPVLNAILTGANQFGGNRAIHEVRTQNGTIALLR
jgi:hypothetical protein